MINLKYHHESYFDDIEAIASFYELQHREIALIASIAARHGDWKLAPTIRAFARYVLVIAECARHYDFRRAPADFLLKK